MICGAFGLLSAAWGLVCLSRADFLTAVVALFAAVFSFGIIAFLVRIASGRVMPRAIHDGHGLTVRPDRRLDTTLLTASLAGFIAMTLYAIFEPLGMLGIRPPSGMALYLVISCAAGSLIGVFSLVHMLVQRGTSVLRMTADGIETGTTMTSQELSWDEVTDVADRKPNARQTNGATYIITADGHTRELPTHWYTPGGTALHELMRFYWQHPEAREELADGRAVGRLEAAPS
ncbi:hypothetical protein BHQ18_11400 [Mycolicibacterium flavescens]|uniref:Uncharacterized protein n=1 Tax=Mycolicibacterium flavescens TaxID=1776 RepID=A0A1E3RKU6_MYCFV|nr:hypothetical protein BHQ18_11400 [Mycolicibacterium flavescens]